MHGPDHEHAAGPVLNGPRRILIVGVTGSGKSTLAVRLGRATGLPVHLVDEEFGWLPGWVQRDPGEQRRLALERVAEPSWIFDSAYSHYRHEVARRADLIVCLDYRRWVSLVRLVRRSVRRAISREAVCNGNVETWGTLFSADSILRWHARSFAGKRERIRALADAYGPRKVLRFRSARRAQRWLEGVNAAGRIPWP